MDLKVNSFDIASDLVASGALLICGPKGCGKTESAKQFAKSVINLDANEDAEIIMNSAPHRLLAGETPRLIDEWQEIPKIWNYVRHEVDDRRKEGQFILAGSSNPEERIKMHSGAGRFTTLDMKTMSWKELGYSSGKVSMKDLFKNKKIDIIDEPISLEVIVEKIIIGGFPGLINKKIETAIDINQGYIDLICEVDISRVSHIKRDPIKVEKLLQSLARNTSTLVDIKTLELDIRKEEKAEISRPTIYEYLDGLERLMIIEEQPSWNTHIRSTASLHKTPKRHFCDVSLSVAALGGDEDTLFNDMKFMGLLFESLVIHELKVYTQANDAKVYYYQDSHGLEVDAIVQKRNGEWMAFEIKLGTGQIEEAAKNLNKFASKIDTRKVKPPISLNIITGTGISFTRKDGVNVISIASLGP